MIRDMGRREFIGGLAAVGCLGAQLADAYSVGSPLGFQAHGLRRLMDVDFPGTLKKMAGIGYQRVELDSFKGYSADTPRDGFGPLAPLEPAFIRKTIHDAGLECIACEFKFSELEDDVIDQTMEWAHGVGVKYMTVSDLPPNPILDEWRLVFEKLNRHGERVRKEGMKMLHHTGPVDWGIIDGKMPMDLLLESVDAQHCQIELDLESTVTMGVDGADYMDKHPGRFFAIHLRDAKTPTTLGKYINSLPLGEGDIDWKKMFRSAKKSGVQMYDVEMEIAAPGDPIEAFRISYNYIRDLKV